MAVKTKVEARQKVRFAEIITPSGMVEVWADLPFTAEEKAINEKNKVNTRNIDYLYFPALKVGGSGKDAEDLIKWTFSTFEGFEKALKHPKVDGEGMLFAHPKISAWMGDSDKTIRETMAAISIGVKNYNENIKEDGPTVLRNVKTMTVEQLAKVMAVLDTELIDVVTRFLSENKAEIVAAKRNLEETNGRDDLGQIRLKAKKKEEAAEGAEPAAAAAPVKKAEKK